MVRHITRLIIAAVVFTAPIAAISQHESHGEEHHEEVENSHDDQHQETSHENSHETNHEAGHGDSHHHDDEHGHEEKFVAGDFIMHHIADANEIQFCGDVSVPLPMIIYVEGKGLDVFMSSSFHSEHGGHGGHGPYHATGPSTGVEYTKDENGISAKDHGEEVAIWDISITKSVFGMLMILTLMILMLRSAAKSTQEDQVKRQRD